MINEMAVLTIHGGSVGGTNKYLVDRRFVDQDNTCVLSCSRLWLIKILGGVKSKLKETAEVT